MASSGDQLSMKSFQFEARHIWRTWSVSKHPMRFHLKVHVLRLCKSRFWVEMSRSENMWTVWGQVDVNFQSGSCLRTHFNLHFRNEIESPMSRAVWVETSSAIFVLNFAGIFFSVASINSDVGMLEDFASIRQHQSTWSEAHFFTRISTVPVLQFITSSKEPSTKSGSIGQEESFLS